MQKWLHQSICHLGCGLVDGWFNVIRQLTRYRHLSNNIEPSVYGGNTPYVKLLSPLVICGHAHLDSCTDSQALRPEYCIVRIPYNTAIWLYIVRYLHKSVVSDCRNFDKYILFSRQWQWLHFLYSTSSRSCIIQILAPLSSFYIHIF